MKKKFFISLLFWGSLLHIYSQTPGPGCPNVNAGPDQVLACNTNCTDLTASIFQTGETTSYEVASIPFAPPYAFNQGTPFAINTDDIWSGVINLPFTFCFYGNSYTQLVVGANGVISFNLAYANQFCPWQFNQAVPNANLPLNAIFGAYHDVDPSICGTIRYAVLGSWPCRTFVFNYNGVCHYSCTNLTTTQQIVLYETTNVIEVYIQNKPTCNGWNSGNAVIGIQNATGTVGLTPPGRNTGPWTANNEAWRFTPNGAPNYTINWYEGNDLVNSIGNTPTLQVCPSNSFTTYSAILTYNSCGNNTVTVWDAVNVSLTSPPAPQISSNSPLCAGGSLQLFANTIPNSTYHWSGPNNFSSNQEDPVIANPTAANSGTYSLYVVQNGCTSATVTTDVIIGNPSPPQLGSNGPICAGQDLLLTANTIANAAYVWSGPNGFSSTAEDPVITGATAAASGQYSAYVVVAGCTSSTATINVVVNPIPAAPNLGSNSPVCEGGTINLTSNALPNATYVWSGPNNFTSGTQSPSIPNASAASAGDYSAFVVVSGCTSAVSTVNVVINPPPTSTFTLGNSVCPGEPVAVTYTGNAATNATYTWNFGNATVMSGSGAGPYSVSWPQSGTFDVTLTVTENGCTSPLTTQSVTIFNIPSADFTVTSPVCENLPSVITYIGSGTGNDTYTWDFSGGDVVSGSGPGPYQVSWAAQGAYDVSLTVTQNGCTSQPFVQTVIVAPPPTANFAITPQVCLGDTVFALYAGNAPANAQYNWVPSAGGNVLAGSGQGPVSFSWNAAGNHTVSLTVDINGCISPVFTQDVTVIDRIIPNAGPDAAMCSGDQINVGVAGSPQAVYTWLTPQGLGDPSSVPTTFTQTIGGNTVQNVTLVLQADNQGCLATDTALIVITPIPVASFVAPSAQCFDGNSFNFTAGGTFIPTATFSWAFANGQPAVSDSQNPTGVSFSQSGSNEVTLVISQNGCVSEPFTAPVITTDSPVAAFSALPVQGCVPLSVTFNNLTIGGQAPMNYQWTFGTGSGSSQSNPTYVYTQSGVYTVSLTVTDANGCTSTNTQVNLIRVLEYPTAGFSILPSVIYMDQPFTQVFDGSTGGVVSWNYSVSNGSFYTSPDFTVSFSDTGTYFITQVVSNESGCTDEITQYLQVLPISEIFVPNAFTPGNKDNLNNVFKPIVSNISNFSMMIFDRWGELIFSTTDSDEGWTGKVRSSKVDAKSDVYVWKIEYWDHLGVEKQLIGHVTLVR